MQTKLVRDGARIRLFTRNGANWAHTVEAWWASCLGLEGEVHPLGERHHSGITGGLFRNRQSERQS